MPPKNAKKDDEAEQVRKSSGLFSCSLAETNAHFFPSQIRYACMTLSSYKLLLRQFIARLFDDLFALVQLTRIAIVDDQKCKPKKCTQE